MQKAFAATKVATKAFFAQRWLLRSVAPVATWLQSIGDSIQGSPTHRGSCLLFTAGSIQGAVAKPLFVFGK